MDRKRALIQTLVAVLTNSYIKGFMDGKIFTGRSKGFCVPGLSCYSCPGALGSCPVGAYQAVACDRGFSIPLYIVGFLAIVGGACGRLVCGWLCPFGLFQDLLNRVPVKFKISEVRGDKYIKNLRYVVLAVFVVILPEFAVNEFGQGDPWFCKYVCPAGTLMAGLPLVLANEGIRGAIGALFAWKAAVLAVLVLLSTAVYRPFCRYVCPLGAVYGLFNRVSLYKISFDPGKCSGCGACEEACLLRIKVKEHANSADCIRCSKCIKTCKPGALSGGVHYFEQGRKKEVKNV
ncbi:MAG: 4Fe-4S binding protein [Clostridiales bacterium]|nr:4Fe-4S binding protein [Clostridiales bacterium]